MAVSIKRVFLCTLIPGPPGTPSRPGSPGAPLGPAGPGPPRSPAGPYEVKSTSKYVKETSLTSTLTIFR